jgi:GTP-binding nuclear protein Ran
MIFNYHISTKMAFKVVLLGDCCSGKTTWIGTYLGKEFSSKYVTTLGVDVCPVSLETPQGRVFFNVWDCAGQEKYGRPRDDDYLHSDACIAFFDLSSNTSPLRTSELVRQYLRINPNTPILWVGNKCDLELDEKRKSNIKTIFEILSPSPFIEVSVKERINQDTILPRLYDLLSKKR